MDSRKNGHWQSEFHTRMHEIECETYSCWSKKVFSYFSNDENDENVRIDSGRVFHVPRVATSDHLFFMNTWSCAIWLCQALQLLLLLLLTFNVTRTLIITHITAVRQSRTVSSCQIPLLIKILFHNLVFLTSLIISLSQAIRQFKIQVLISVLIIFFIMSFSRAIQQCKVPFPTSVCSSLTSLW